ncbi:SgcJ/EcaC family oxidoreductase [Nocardia sp. NBC_01503]|uniref:SgcJ/EcaC family oxidoreductase n=1 Tax=Nocardia sp. NBC_01503 TaxID=2975997 RepID=UPI002E7B10F8|nr:SgcJ/EcaC family oxidoreductase [Nocardia sp. NBC_01503]WTL32908.1 SgcJ/EcaC family oxidoreductase [Nocardia sp. NBC_01503]
MLDPDALVREMCAAWVQPDADHIASFFTEDAVYHNIPMDPVVGRQAIRDFIAGFAAALDGIDFKIHRQLVTGNLVMNERTDVLRGAGRETELPVVGVFEITDGKIAAWRDYFDMAPITRAFGG